jgi:hypothetical protein
MTLDQHLPNKSGLEVLLPHSIHNGNGYAPTYSPSNFDRLFLSLRVRKTTCFYAILLLTSQAI